MAKKSILRGTGTNGADIFIWQRPSLAEDITERDPRHGKLLCSKCDAEVDHVPLEDGGWMVVGPDGLPHRLTCEGV